MKTAATTVDEYLARQSETDRASLMRLRQTIEKNLPRGFEETIVYGMIGYVVPLKTYPSGYHAGKGVPLPFIQLAQQKNYVAIYHMGLTVDAELLAWFRQRWAEKSSVPLDLGKSCIRLPHPERAPLDVLGELARKLTPSDWIARYEAAFGGARKSSKKAADEPKPLAKKKVVKSPASTKKQVVEKVAPTKKKVASTKKQVVEQVAPTKKKVAKKTTKKVASSKKPLKKPVKKQAAR